MAEGFTDLLQSGLERAGAKGAFFEGSERASEANEVSLTFDDGPSFRTARLLDRLNSRGFKATFFLFADEAREVSRKSPELFKRIIEAVERGGHEIGLHGDYREKTEGLMAKVTGPISSEKMKQDKEDLERLTGKKITSFRQHNWQVGQPMRETIGAAEQLGMKTVLFSFEVTLDAKSSSVRQNMAIFKGIRGGGIVDVHERKGQSGLFGKSLVTDPLEVVDACISNMRMKGLKGVTISEILQ